MYVPEGFAHGFQTLTDNCELVYLHSEFYHAASEGGLHVNDPKLAINWPLPINVLSGRDNNFNLIDEHFKGI